MMYLAHHCRTSTPTCDVHGCKCTVGDLGTGATTPDTLKGATNITLGVTGATTLSDTLGVTGAKNTSH